jgi:hypothetical protein
MIFLHSRLAWVAKTPKVFSGYFLLNAMAIWLTEWKENEDMGFQQEIKVKEIGTKQDTRWLMHKTH